MSSSSSWSANIERLTLLNKNWRKVIFTGPQLQVVLMSVPPGESLGWEVHKESDQFFRIESGRGVLETRRGKDVKRHQLNDGSVAVVPVRVWHNITNKSSSRLLQIYTIYAPPHHPPNTVHKTREDEI